VRKEVRIVYSVFKLRTERVDHAAEGQAFGKAWLSFPGGENIDIVSLLQSLGHGAGRIGREDDVWEQRLIEYTIEYLETRDVRQKLYFHTLTSITPRLNTKIEMTLLLVFSSS
jgi:hypothetical protein